MILQKVFQVNSVESLRPYKIFVKLLNRMLWMHGQGLWNCFSTTTNNSSWESIFSKSSFTITENELKCCYRLVELCKDCVLIVYQYAFEQKPNKFDQSTNGANENGTVTINNLRSNNNTPTNSFYHNRSNLNKFKNISASTSSLNLKSKLK